MAGDEGSVLIPEQRMTEISREVETYNPQSGQSVGRGVGVGMPGNSD